MAAAPHNTATLLAILSLVAVVSAHGKYTRCLAKVKSLQNDGLLEPQWEYTGTIRGFDPNAGYARPVTLTYEGCKALCGGNAPDLNDVFTALSVLTTWVLPSVALFSNLPYEALTKHKHSKTFEAFTSWIGSPQTALTNTFFNIFVIRSCQSFSHLRTREPYRDALYVLSCIGQYEYRTIGVDPAARLRRDRALVYGILNPLRVDDDDPKVKYSRVMISNLAFQLRCNRRRGVFPVLINVTWFMVAFAFSLVTAFANLGDNTTAHSLALGIFVSWLPVLICSTVTDRNPTASTRCAVLINRWLYNTDKIMSAIDGKAPKWYRPEDKLDFDVNDYIGQGRRLRYCGVASALLRLAEQRPFRSEADQKTFTEYHEEISIQLRETITHRPRAWWLICLVSHLFVSQQVFIAFVIAFKTPTVGLGCRSILYLIYFLVSLITSTVQVVFQEPPRWTRFLTIPANTLNTLLLLAIMMLHTTGGLNSCYCKTSPLGIGFGGYTDLQNSQYYKKVFHVVNTWGPAAAVGMLGCILWILWCLRTWSKSSELWSVDEDPSATEMAELDVGVDMIWLV